MRSLIIRFFILLGLFFSAQASAVNTAPGFVVGGKAASYFGSYLSSVTVQSDGKFLVTGSSGNDFLLARYNADGSPDTSFSGDGKVTTDFGSFYEGGNSVTVQADGKILVAGHGTSASSNYAFALARYNTNGSLDTSFDTDGKVITAIRVSHDIGNSVAVQADSKILVAGFSYNGSNIDFALVRYNTNGSLDTSFDADGKVTTVIGTYSKGLSVTVQADSKILVAGFSYNGSNNDFALVRYNTNGSLDTSFDADGKVTTDLGGGDVGYSVTVQTDGKILVVGRSGNGICLVRYNTDGSLDTTFDTDGKVTTQIGTYIDYGNGYSVTVQADGKILVAGSSGNGGNGTDFALVRYNTDGSLDTSFSGGGKVTTDFSGSDTGYSVTVQADGKILVAGSSGNGTYFAIVRYNADGSLDTTFVPGGFSTLNGTSPSYTENGAPVVLDSDVQIFDAELSAATNYASASLTLARNGGANAQDVFSNVGTLGALTQGGNLTVGGTTIGTVTANSNGTLTLTFDSGATQNLVDSAMQQITYSNISGTPPAFAQINWTFNDGNSGAQGTGGALAVTGSTTVSIIAVQTIGAITFSPTTLAVGGTATASATATSGLAVTYSSTTTGICTVSGNTVTGIAVGTCTIAANQAGNANYNAATQVTQTITTGKASQTVGAISFSPNTLAVSGFTTVSATASSGLSVAFTVPVTTGVCTISGSTVTGVTAGTCTVAADQAGNANYAAATQTMQNITIGQIGQTITFDAAPGVIVGGTGTVSATGGASGNAVIFTVPVTSSVCTISGSTVTGLTAGTCTIAANQAGNANYAAATQVTQNITIGQAGQTITFNAAPSVVVGGTGTVSATGGASGNAVTFTVPVTTGICTISGSTVTGIATGSCIVAANQAGDANYNAATQVTQNIPIGKSSQTITFGAAPTVVVGGTGLVSATGGASNNPVIFTVPATTGVCTISGSTVTGIAAGTCTVAADQAGNANYTAATQATQNITVGKAGQAITFGAAPTIAIGAIGTVSATATSGLAVSFSSANTGICTVSGITVTGVTAGTCTIAANQAGNATYNAATQVTQSITIGSALPPGAPTIPAATAGNGSATLSFFAPLYNGGSAISGYKATCGTTTVSGASSPITVAPLINGTTYACTVKATNSVGDSAPSAVVSVTPFGGNTAPTFVMGDGKVTTAFGTYADGRSVAKQADGKILVAGTSDNKFALVRYNTDGSLDMARSRPPSAAALAVLASPCRPTARFWSRGQATPNLP